jgi:autotransporter passenger strand-loop-strand repeat protein
VSFGFQFVDSTGVALATTVKNHGTDVVEGGGEVSGLIVSSGGLFEGIGNAVVIAAQFRSGALIRVGSGFVFNSAVGNGVTEQVLSAGTGTGSVSSGGTLIVRSGGLAAGATVFKGGAAFVRSGGTIGAMVVSGVDVISSGGVESGATISKGGIEKVLSAGLPVPQPSTAAARRSFSPPARPSL